MVKPNIFTQAADHAFLERIRFTTANAKGTVSGAAETNIDAQLKTIKTITDGLIGDVIAELEQKFIPMLQEYTRMCDTLGDNAKDIDAATASNLVVKEREIYRLYAQLITKNPYLHLWPKVNARQVYNALESAASHRIDYYKKLNSIKEKLTNDQRDIVKLRINNQSCAVYANMTVATAKVQTRLPSGIFKRNPLKSVLTKHQKISQDKIVFSSTTPPPITPTPPPSSTQPFTSHIGIIEDAQKKAEVIVALAEAANDHTDKMFINSMIDPLDALKTADQAAVEVIDDMAKDGDRASLTDDQFDEVITAINEWLEARVAISEKLNDKHDWPAVNIADAFNADIAEFRNLLGNIDAFYGGKTPQSQVPEDVFVRINVTHTATVEPEKTTPFTKQIEIINKVAQDVIDMKLHTFGRLRQNPEPQLIQINIRHLTQQFEQKALGAIDTIRTEPDLDHVDSAHFLEVINGVSNWLKNRISLQGTIGDHTTWPTQKVVDTLNEEVKLFEELKQKLIAIKATKDFEMSGITGSLNSLIKTHELDTVAPQQHEKVVRDIRVIIADIAKIKKTYSKDKQVEPLLKQFQDLRDKESEASSHIAFLTKPDNGDSLQRVDLNSDLDPIKAVQDWLEARADLDTEMGKRSDWTNSNIATLFSTESTIFYAMRIYLLRLKDVVDFDTVKMELALNQLIRRHFETPVKPPEPVQPTIPPIPHPPQREPEPEEIDEEPEVTIPDEALPEPAPIHISDEDYQRFLQIINKLELQLRNLEPSNKEAESYMVETLRYFSNLKSELDGLASQLKNSNSATAEQITQLGLKISQAIENQNQRIEGIKNSLHSLFENHDGSKRLHNDMSILVRLLQEHKKKENRKLKKIFRRDSRALKDIVDTFNTYKKAQAKLEKKLNAIQDQCVATKKAIDAHIASVGSEPSQIKNVNKHVEDLLAHLKTQFDDLIKALGKATTERRDWILSIEAHLTADNNILKQILEIQRGEVTVNQNSIAMVEAIHKNARELNANISNLLRGKAKQQRAVKLAFNPTLPDAHKEFVPNKLSKEETTKFRAKLRSERSKTYRDLKKLIEETNEFTVSLEKSQNAQLKSHLSKMEKWVAMLSKQLSDEEKEFKWGPNATIGEQIAFLEDTLSKLREGLKPIL